MDLEEHKDLVLYLHGKELSYDSETPIHDLGITRFLEDGLKYEAEYITLTKDGVKHFFSRKVGDDLKSEIAKRGLGDRVSIFSQDGVEILKADTISNKVSLDKRPIFSFTDLQANGHIYLEIDISTKIINELLEEKETIINP